jgi:hypothetical protein
MAFALVALVITQFASPSAKADTLNVSGAFDYGLNGPAYYIKTITFDLPAGFTNATFSINSYIADDSSVAYLNGTVFTNPGIYGPGNGQFSFDGVSTVPYTFLNGNESPSFLFSSNPISLLMAGSNTLSFVVNNTNNGIFQGFPSGGPTQYAFDATITFDAAAVPGPIVGAGLPGLVMALSGFVAWRRRRNQAAAA